MSQPTPAQEWRRLRREAREAWMLEMYGEHRPLPPLTGNGWGPVFADRPGSYRATADLASAMPLFRAIYSFTSDYYRPLYASWDTLATTIGVGRKKVAQELEKLKRAALVFEVDRGRGGNKRRPPARWAVDPFADEIWRDRIEFALKQIKEEDGQSARWLARHLQRLNFFHRNTRALANAIAEDCPVEPKRRRRRKPKKNRNRHSPSRGLEVVFIPPMRSGSDGETEGVKGALEGAQLGRAEETKREATRSRNAALKDRSPEKGPWQHGRQHVH